MRWRQATLADSFRQGEMVVIEAEKAQAVVIADTPAGSPTVRVETQRKAGPGNTWDTSDRGAIP